MANDPGYDAVLSLAGVHLQRAWDNFCTDPKGLPWRQLAGNSPKVRVKSGSMPSRKRSLIIKRSNATYPEMEGALAIRTLSVAHARALQAPR
jgi:hypothetical protein